MSTVEAPAPGAQAPRVPLAIKAKQSPANPTQKNQDWFFKNCFTGMLIDDSTIFAFAVQNAGEVKADDIALQAEGVHVQTLLNSDIVVPNVLDALDLFIDDQRLIATMRR